MRPPASPFSRALPAALLALAAGAPVALGQIATDACTTAPFLTLNPSPAPLYPGNNLSATTDGSTTCASTSFDVWYRYTPAPSEVGMLIELSACANFDTVVSVHSGCPGTAANAIACNYIVFGPTCSAFMSTKSRLTFTPTANTTYAIRIAGTRTSPGSLIQGNYLFRAQALIPTAVTINTDSLTITGDDGDPNTFFGTPFTASIVNGVAVFAVSGDLNIPTFHALTFTGNLPASIVVGNNMSVGSLVTFTAAPGTVGGGLAFQGALGRAGGTGGFGTLAGNAGLGGAGGTVRNCGLNAGNPGAPGTAGDPSPASASGSPGLAGLAGVPGTSGFNSSSSFGIGGSGGAAGNGGAGTPGVAGGAGGNGGNGSLTLAGSGRPGNSGSPGNPGAAGAAGAPGANGGLGLNTGTTTALAGGGGGGSGGSGGGGGAGSAGSGGGAGGGGGGGGASSCLPGAVGGIGGAGGQGGSAGSGGASGNGGNGGNGGGAFEFIVLGSLQSDGIATVDGGDATPANPPAAAPTAGSGGAPASPGSAGANSGSVAGNGGNGGNSGAGGFGGDGGSAGVSGGGGGGGGGTLRLIATKLLAFGNTVINARGGNNGFGGRAGNGRAVIGSSLPSLGFVTVNGDQVPTTGPRSPNIFLQTQAPVPYMAGFSPAAPYQFLPVGGVPDSLLTGLPANSLLAATRVTTATGSFADEYQGFQYVFVKNLSPFPITTPQIGFGAADFAVNLQRGGWISDPRFGGTPQLITTLQPGEGFVMLIPAATADQLNLTASTATATFSTRAPLPLNATVALLGSAACSVADIVSIGGQPPADGLLTGDDFNAFIAAFANGEPPADIVGIGGEPPPDGLITGDDFNAFVAAFANGCP